MMSSFCNHFFQARAISLFFMTDKDIIKIYKSSKWAKTRLNQLETDHYECQRCKHRGKYKNLTGLVKYTRAVLVHHDYRLRQYPQYAFSPYVNGERNLYSLCQSCHEIEHEEERGLIEKPKELNEERW